MKILQNVGCLALLSLSAGLVSCQTYYPSASQSVGGLGNAVASATQNVGTAASSSATAASQNLGAATRNVGWFARNSATRASQNVGTATRNVGWFARSGVTNVGSGLATASDNMAGATRRFGRNIFVAQAPRIPSNRTVTPVSTSSPANLSPVSGNAIPLLSRAEANAKGYAAGYEAGTQNLAPEPASNAIIATATNQRAYYAAYMRGWTVGADMGVPDGE